MALFLSPRANIVVFIGVSFIKLHWRLPLLLEQSPLKEWAGQTGAKKRRTQERESSHEKFSTSSKWRWWIASWCCSYPSSLWHKSGRKAIDQKLMKPRLLGRETVNSTSEGSVSLRGTSIMACLWRSSNTNQRGRTNNFRVCYARVPENAYFILPREIND